MIAYKVFHHCKLVLHSVKNMAHKLIAFVILSIQCVTESIMVGSSHSQQTPLNDLEYDIENSKTSAAEDRGYKGVIFIAKGRENPQVRTGMRPSLGLSAYSKSAIAIPGGTFDYDGGSHIRGQIQRYGVNRKNIPLRNLYSRYGAYSGNSSNKGNYGIYYGRMIPHEDNLGLRYVLPFENTHIYHGVPRGATAVPSTPEVIEVPVPVSVLRKVPSSVDPAITPVEVPVSVPQFVEVPNYAPAVSNQHVPVSTSSMRIRESHPLSVLMPESYQIPIPVKIPVKLPQTIIIPLFIGGFSEGLYKDKSKEHKILSNSELQRILLSSIHAGLAINHEHESSQASSQAEKGTSEHSSEDSGSSNNPEVGASTGRYSVTSSDKNHFSSFTPCESKH